MGARNYEGGRTRSSPQRNKISKTSSSKSWTTFTSSLYPISVRRREGTAALRLYKQTAIDNRGLKRAGTMRHERRRHRAMARSNHVKFSHATALCCFLRTPIREQMVEAEVHCGNTIVLVKIANSKYGSVYALATIYEITPKSTLINDQSTSSAPLMSSRPTGQT